MLTYQQRLEVAQIAKELTLEFAGKIKYTDTSTNKAMNDQLVNNVSDFYLTIYSSILDKVEEESK